MVLIFLRLLKLGCTVVPLEKKHIKICHFSRAATRSGCAIKALKIAFKLLKAGGQNAFLKGVKTLFCVFLRFSTLFYWGSLLFSEGGYINFCIPQLLENNYFSFRRIWKVRGTKVDISKGFTGVQEIVFEGGRIFLYPACLALYRIMIIIFFIFYFRDINWARSGRENFLPPHEKIPGDFTLVFISF